MRLCVKLAAILTLAVTALAAFGTTLAGAYPTTRHTPHIALGRTSAPTTAECEAAFEIACYQPGQIQKAYNLPELYAQGDEGQGTTIVIVDSSAPPQPKRT